MSFVKVPLFDAKLFVLATKRPNNKQSFMFSPNSDEEVKSSSSCSEIKKGTRSKANLSLVSTVFDPDPEKLPNTKPVSKTYKCTSDKPCRVQLIPNRQICLEPFAQPNMTGSTCDVDVNGSGLLMSSDFAKTTLKKGNLAPSASTPSDSLGYSATANVDDFIVSSTGTPIHYKCREKSTVSASYKSEGVKGNEEVAGNSLQLWSSENDPQLMASKIGKSGKNYHSHVFTPDKKAETSTLWTSDFQRSPFLCGRKYATKALESTVFLPPNVDGTISKNKAVSKTYQSSIFV